MQFLDQVFLDNTVRDWLVAAAIAIAVTAGLRIVVALVLRRLRSLAERTTNDIDDIAIRVLDSTKFVFLLFLGVWAGSRALVLTEGMGWALRLFGVVVMVLQVAAWGTVAITALINRQVRLTVEDDPGTATAMNALGFLMRVGLWVLLLLAALDNMGIEIGPLLAGLGVGGIAVALALQNVLGDLFASLSIVLDKPFVIGDFIVVGDKAGTVENVGLKTTRVRSLSGEQLVFANSDLLASRIQNYKRMIERRILFSIGVIYQTPREKLARIPTLIRETIESIDKTRFDRAHFLGFGPSSLDFEIVYFVLSREYNEYMDTQQAINLDLVRKFQAEGIEFAYPTRTLFLERGESWPTG